ncbi:anti-repressor SinI family protein [Virgibacillus kekensis]|uniref:Anti-repressor SinI family protein n=1 Tax=Virgibacillus kekensis TaxID=202261 RepID=A0ABV9DGW2_9BACI
MQSAERKVELGNDLDLEWVFLMKEAKAIGLTVEDIRLFLEKDEKK